MSFPQRLTLIINELGYTKNSFAEKLGYKTNNLIYDYTREDEKKKEPGFEFFVKLVRSKIGINLEWLLTGEGDKYIKKPTLDTKSEGSAISMNWLLDQFSALNNAHAVAINTIAEQQRLLSDALGSKVIKDGEKDVTLAQHDMPAQ